MRNLNGFDNKLRMLQEGAGASNAGSGQNARNPGCAVPFAARRASRSTTWLLVKHLNFTYIKRHHHLHRAQRDLLPHLLTSELSRQDNIITKPACTAGLQTVFGYPGHQCILVRMLQLDMHFVYE